MQSWGSYSYAYGPLVAFAVVGLLVLLLRWAFSRGQSLVERPVRPAEPDRYGLLTPVAAPRSVADGEALRRLRAAAGVRASLVVTSDGPRLMVWPDDVDRARRLLASRSELDGPAQ